MPLIPHRFSENIWRVHSLYNIVTGIWPLVHLRSFEAVSGPKTDGWLVKMVGILVAVNGAIIATAGRKSRISPEIAGLAIGSSAGLAAIDIVYVARRRISPVYLLDALMELVLIGGWIARWQRSRGAGNTQNERETTN